MFNSSINRISEVFNKIRQRNILHQKIECLLVFISLVLFHSSCTFELQKRLYRKGYHFDFETKSNHKYTSIDIKFLHSKTPFQNILATSSKKSSDSIGLLTSCNLPNQRESFTGYTIPHKQKKLITKSNNFPNYNNYRLKHSRNFRLNKTNNNVEHCSNTHSDEPKFLRRLLSLGIYLLSMLIIFGLPYLFYKVFHIAALVPISGSIIEVFRVAVLPISISIITSTLLSYNIKKKIFKSDTPINEEDFKKHKKQLMFFLIFEILLMLFLGLFWYWYLYYIQASSSLLMGTLLPFLVAVLVPIQSSYLAKQRTYFYKYKFDDNYKKWYTFSLIIFILILLNWVLLFLPYPDALQFYILFSK